MQGWLTGWKANSGYIGKTIKTAKKYHNRYHMPVYRGPDNMPYSLPGELDLWLKKFDQKKREQMA